jgi:hypothetical protein
MLEELLPGWKAYATVHDPLQWMAVALGCTTAHHTLPARTGTVSQTWCQYAVSWGLALWRTARWAVGFCQVICIHT